MPESNHKCEIADNMMRNIQEANDDPNFLAKVKASFDAAMKKSSNMGGDSAKPLD